MDLLTVGCSFLINLSGDFRIRKIRVKLDSPVSVRHYINVKCITINVIIIIVIITLLCVSCYCIYTAGPICLHAYIVHAFV